MILNFVSGAPTAWNALRAHPERRPSGQCGGSQQQTQASCLGEDTGPSRSMGFLGTGMVQRLGCS